MQNNQADGFCSLMSGLKIFPKMAMWLQDVIPIAGMQGNDRATALIKLRSNKHLPADAGT